MRLDGKPGEDSKVESECSDFEEICDNAESRKVIQSNSTSSSDAERTELDDSDNDSGFVGVLRGSLDRLDTVTPEVDNDVRGNCLPGRGADGTYDRASIIHQLANFDNLDMLLKYIRKVEKLKQEAFGKPLENFQIINSTSEDTDEEYPRSRYERIREALRAVPDSLLHLITGVDRPGDCGRPSDQKPDWLDEEKLRMGQKFAQDYMFPVYYAEMLSLFALFSFEDGLKPLIITGRSSTPYTAFKRYLSTGLRVRNWYTQDPWTKGTAAQKDISTVRTMHAATRRRLEASTNAEIDAAAKIVDAWCPSREILLKDFSDTCKAPAIGQCPYAVWKDSIDRPKGINQSEMAITQWGFVGLLICYPKKFGIHCATDEEFEAYCHLWRSIGYQLGMEDEFNFCRGSLNEIRQRSHDILETCVKPNLRAITPEWEHVLRCLVSGMKVVVVVGLSYETALLYLTEILGLQMPRLYASLSYTDWISYNISKSLFDYSIKLPGTLRLINFMLNRVLDRAAKYTPKELEAIRIKLSSCPENEAKTSS